MTSELAAAILALKEMYERESADQTRPVEGERDLGRQDPVSAWAGEAKARVRIARAMTALATEHELRLATAAELDGLRAEIELLREQLREAVRESQAAEARTDQAEADVLRLRRTSLQRLIWLTVMAATLLTGGWLARILTEPAHDGSNVVIASPGGSGATVEPATKRTDEIASAQSPPAKLDAGPQQVAVPAAVDSSTKQEGGGGSAPTSGPSEDQQQPEVAAPGKEESAEVKLSPATQAPTDAPPDARRILPDEQVGLGQETAPANIEPEQPAPVTTVDTTTPPPVSTSAATVEAVPKASTVTGTALEHVSIHYEQSSPAARANAGRIAALVAHAGFGGTQMLGTEHLLDEPVVRYFFADDADAAERIVNALREKDARWRAEDCTRYRHKPPAGSIQIWPARIR